MGNDPFDTRHRHLAGARSRRLVACVALLSAATTTLAAGGCAAQPPATAEQATYEQRVPSDWAFSLHPEPVEAAQAMVVSDAPLATRVGVAVLRRGGNAIDAAVAVAFALAVVYPEAGNIGGGGFMVARMADGTAASLDFRERAPLAATPTMYLDSAGNVTDRSITGHLSAGVPGAVAGLHEAHSRFGTLPWAALVEPALQLADSGFAIDAAVAGTLRGDADRLARFPGSAALFLPGGRPLAEGTHWRNPDLAAVLRRIALRGPAGFYSGETADLIVAEMRRGGGLITHEDLRGYTAKWREPILFDYRGHTVLSMPPPSSGGLTLAIIAQIMEPLVADAGARGSGSAASGRLRSGAESPGRRDDWHAPLALHYAAEAMRRAFADRNHFLGDPDFVDIPRDLLLSDEYAARLRATIDADRATRSADIAPGLGLEAIGATPAAALPESDHTTHVSIVDALGNAVALTTTINNLYGSAVTVAGAGFLLNDEMDDFTSKPGEPNMFGLVQGEVNAIAPGKRMLSAMTPTIVVAPDGRPLLVTGARGGPRIITGVYQVISNILDYGFDVGSAVHAPRIHHQHLPDALTFEPRGLTPDLIAALRALGHTVEERSGYVATAPTILRVEQGWSGIPDPRTGGLAAGY
jgi:gamma-glutamyltranspeptidase/glutathione hydrolase